MKEVKLVRYDAMVTAIERAATVDEVKEIRAKAIALEAYAAQAMNRENERKCAQIRIRAERRVGELLKADPPKRGGDGSNQHKKQERSHAATLARNRISKDQSSDWQRLASIPEKQFEEELGKSLFPSTEQILHSAYPKKREPSLIANVDPAALDLWGMLCDFERHELLKRDPKQLLDTMTDPMREDTLRLTPVVISWLGRLNGGTNGLLHSEGQLSDSGTVQLTGRAEGTHDLSR